jgi:hypothetical protein
MDWIELHILGSLCHPDESRKTYTTMRTINYLKLWRRINEYKDHI